MEELRKEKNEVPPYLVFTVKDEAGETVRKITTKPSAGINTATGICGTTVRSL